MPSILAGSHTSIQMSTTDNELIVTEALTWVGTPYHHQACVKGVGVDCAMLVAGVANAVGIEVLNTPTNYSTQWNLHNEDPWLIRVLEEYGCKQVPIEETKPGHIICFKVGHTFGHLGIMVSDTTFVHACIQRKSRGSELGVVTHVTLGAEWKRRHLATYEFPQRKTK